MPPRSGWKSALLAARGFTANADVFEAAQGYAPALYDDGFTARDAWLRPRAVPRRRPRLRDQDVSEPVRHPFRHHRRARIAPQYSVDPATIRRVVLTAPVMTYVNRPRPKTGLAGKFSLQYTAASALLDGKVGIRTFTDARLAKHDMQDLLGKFEVVLDPDNSRPFRGDACAAAGRTRRRARAGDAL